MRCSRCGADGTVTCGSCSGRGTHDCGKCDACGRLTTYEYVERSYSPDKEISYRNKSVPTNLLTSADGTRVDIETDQNPSKSDLYRRQNETREISVAIATYEHFGDKWEVFEVEGVLEANEFPRDYSRQFKITLLLLLLLGVPVLLLVTNTTVANLL